MKQLKMYTGVQLQAYLDLSMCGGADLRTPKVAVNMLQWSCLTYSSKNINTIFILSLSLPN